jgi:glycosyltransferase involved in cell wall biosynthesis
MRIVIAFEHVRRFVGAHAQVVTELGRRLVRRGHDVTIVCDTITDPDLYPDLHLIARRPFQSGASHRPWLLHSWAKRRMSELDYDVAISFHAAIAADVLIPTFGFSPGPDRSAGRGPRAMMNRVDPRRFISGVVGSRTRRSRELRCIVALSETMREALLDAVPSIEHIIRRIPGASPVEPPMDRTVTATWRSETREILGLEPEHVVLLWAAKLPAFKGGAAVLKAFAETLALGHPDARLVMACEDPWPLHDLAVDLDCDDEIRLVSRTREMERLLAAADIGVMPTAKSMFGRFVCECMAFGVPVITNTGTASVERLRGPDERIAGRVISSSRPEALRDAMIGLLEPPHREAATRSAEIIAPSMRFDLFVDRMESLAREFAH